MKLLVLVWLTLQNSVHNVLMRYSRSRAVEDMFLGGTAVVCTEAIKVLMCMLIVLVNLRSPYRLVRSIYKNVFCKPWDTLKMACLACTFILQNNLNYVAASHLTVGVFMVSSQLKLFCTVLFAMLILNQRVSVRQWLAIVLLFCGVCLVQTETLHTPNPSAPVTDTHPAPAPSRQERPLLGLLAVVCSSILSGFGTVYFEKIIKSMSPVSIWMRNIQLSVCALPLSCAAAVVAHPVHWHNGNMFIGFDRVVWVTVLWLAIGGLTVAVAIKYADNIAKNFATSLAIILSTAASIPIFGVVPSLQFMIGAATVIIATLGYATAPAQRQLPFHTYTTSKL